MTNEDNPFYVEDNPSYTPSEQEVLDGLFDEHVTAAELSTVNILSLFETTREQRKSFVEDVVSRLTDEQIDPLKVHLQIKAMEDIINSLTCTDEKKNKTPWFAQTYKNLLLAAAEKHGKKFAYQNAEFSIKEVGTAYDFSQCGDKEIIELLAKQEDIKKQVEARKDFLKALPLKGIETVDKETGEMVTVYPPSKSSTTSVSVSLK